MSIRIILCTASQKIQGNGEYEKMYIEKRYTRGRGVEKIRK